MIVSSRKLASISVTVLTFSKPDLCIFGLLLVISHSMTSSTMNSCTRSIPQGDLSIAMLTDTNMQHSIPTRIVLLLSSSRGLVAYEACMHFDHLGNGLADIS